MRIWWSRNIYYS